MKGKGKTMSRDRVSKTSLGGITGEGLWGINKITAKLNQPFVTCYLAVPGLVVRVTSAGLTWKSISII